MILEIMGKDESSIEYVKDRPGHDLRYAVDWSKINRELGWEPKHPFETRLKETIEWYQKNPEWWQKVKSGQYQDYYQKNYENKK